MKATSQKCLPAIATLAIFAAGMAAMFIHVAFGDRASAGPSRQWFQLVPSLVPLAAGLAAGAAVWLLQKNQRHRRELEAANQALAQMNEKLRLEAGIAQQSEQRFHLLFSSNPCPMWIFDCQTLAITDVNEAALRQYGYTREEFLCVTALDLRPPEEFDRFRERIQGSDEGYGHRGIWIHRRKDGTRLQAEIRAFRFAHEGRVRELVLAQDATARVEAEEALMLSWAALKSIRQRAFRPLLHFAEARLL